jgi:hypothetical protein
MRIGIHAEVKLAPPPVRPDTVFLIEPFAFAVNLETSAVDKKMKWLVAGRCDSAISSDRRRVG